MSSRPLRHGLILAGLLFLGHLFLVVAPQVQTFGYDAFAYWSVSLPNPYGIPVGSLGSFNYAPPIALLFDGFSLIPWWVFSYLWFMLLVGTVIFIGGNVYWALVAFAFPPVALELYHGNVHILIAVAIVLGFRHPWTWSFIVLTKVTTGIGLLWFAVRGEWRSLAIAALVTVTLSLAAWLYLPTLWHEWLSYLLDTSELRSGSSYIAIPLFVRLPLAALIVAWGARTDRRWTVAVAVTLAVPVLWFAAAAVLIAVIPELAGRRHGSALAPAANSDKIGRD